MLTLVMGMPEAAETMGLMVFANMAFHSWRL
jgi:hypothetical protein